MKNNAAAPTKLQVLEVISDKVTLDIFNAIAKNPETSESLKQNLNLPHKVYYSRSASLLKTNLIERKNGKYFVTSFGKLIRQALLKIVCAADHSWQLKVIDSVISRNEIPNEARKEVIDRIIDNAPIKELIFSMLITDPRQNK
jgi:hypothetical protein